MVEDYDRGKIRSTHCLSIVNLFHWYVRMCMCISEVQSAQNAVVALMPCELINRTNSGLWRQF